jgi:uncharacterized membrane protein
VSPVRPDTPDPADPRPIEDAASRTTHLVIRTGLAVSLALMGIGALLHFATGDDAQAVAYTELLTTPNLGDRVLMVGTLVLALTPAAQILVLLASWWRLRDYRYAAVAATVIAMLVIGAVLGAAR